MTTKTYLPDFYQLYDVAADADERSLKKVYARELKKIDQASQAPQFQQLREHYEQALNWYTYQQKVFICESGVTKNEQAGKSQKTDIEDLTVKKSERLKSLTETTLSTNTTTQDQPTKSSSHSKISATNFALSPQKTAAFLLRKICSLVEDINCQESQLSEQLTQIVLEAKLAHIDTLDYFEKYLISYLQEGWIGHKHWLFKISLAKFQWDRLQYKDLLRKAKSDTVQFQSAIIEFQRFEEIPWVKLLLYEELLQQARDGEEYSDNALIEKNNMLHILMTNYENLIWFYSDSERLRSWYRRSEELCPFLTIATKLQDQSRNITNRRTSKLHHFLQNRINILVVATLLLSWIFFSIFSK